MCYVEPHYVGRNSGADVRYAHEPRRKYLGEKFSIA